MLLSKLWKDELGATVSLETVMVGTVGVLAVTGGIATLADAINDELGEMAMAVRGFNQSYTVSGYTTAGTLQTGVPCQGGTLASTTFQAFKAGSGFQQQAPNIDIQQNNSSGRVNLRSDLDIGGQQSQSVSAARSIGAAEFAPTESAVFETRNIERISETAVDTTVESQIRTNRDSGDCSKAKSY